MIEEQPRAGRFQDRCRQRWSRGPGGLVAPSTACTRPPTRGVPHTGEGNSAPSAAKKRNRIVRVSRRIPPCRGPQFYQPTLTPPPYRGREILTPSAAKKRNRIAWVCRRMSAANPSTFSPVQPRPAAGPASTLSLFFLHSLKFVEIASIAGGGLELRGPWSSQDRRRSRV